MAEETQGEEIWFVKWARSIVHTLLYDKDAAMGWVVLSVGFLGTLVTTGGVVPGTDIVLPIPPTLAKFGPLFGLVALRMATGARKSKVAPELVGLVQAMRAETAASPVIAALKREAPVVEAVKEEAKTAAPEK